MAMIDDLQKLGREIEAAKRGLAQNEGRHAEIMERLKSNHGIETIEDGEKLIDEKNEELAKLNASIAADFKQLQENFSW